MTDIDQAGNEATVNTEETEGTVNNQVIVKKKNIYLLWAGFFLLIVLIGILTGLFFYFKNKSEDANLKYDVDRYNTYNKYKNVIGGILGFIGAVIILSLLSLFFRKNTDNLFFLLYAFEPIIKTLAFLLYLILCAFADCN